MALDPIGATPGTGVEIAADLISGNSFVVDKIAFGPYGTVTLVAAVAGSGLPIEGITGGNPVPVSGSFYQASQPVSIAATVSVAIASGSVGITGTVPVSGTFWPATQPISGTVTANAGINLNTSALALESGGHLASIDSHIPALGQALAAASVPVVLTAAQLTTLTPVSTVTANAGTNLNTSALALEAGGHLASVDGKVPALGQALAAASVPVVLTALQVTALTPPTSVTANAGTNLNTSLLALEAGGNLASLNTKTPALGQALAAASVPVVLTALQVTTLTPPTTVTVTQATGTNLHTVVDTMPAMTNTVATTGGATPYQLISAASTNATNVKNAAGTLYGIQASNTNASPRWLKIYNKASAPTVGTDVPVKTIMLPGNVNGGGNNVSFGPIGIALGTGISFAITANAAVADTTAVAAGEVVLNLDYA